MTPKEIDGQTVTQRATAKAAAGFNVYKKYAGPGGLKEEFVQTAQRHPLITKLETIGKTTNGQDIVALKVTLGAPLTRGRRPSPRRSTWAPSTRASGSRPRWSGG